ncbi:RluA family pseudouridine synthase [Lentibacillus sp. Marseille-P4043]|uniref:RluA family pseudouridine synthase n=1 Tax=Lentibacillus sp. Marseille-P4043 TaxID=2040293 RepID=UPI001F39154E|nr:RluA family pseudouridine synthase [Lentibacillus sp. Marseille-P4043]
MQWTIKKEHDGMSIRDYLQQVQGFSRRILKGIKFDGGEIWVNGAAKMVSFCLTAGDVLQIQFPPEIIGAGMKPETLPLTIIYEDDALIILEKPAGIATIPSMNHASGTIANRLLGYYQHLNIPFTIHVVTRLDRDTSGLMLIAKHRYSHSLLSRSQKEGKVKRHYQAIVEGRLPMNDGTIEQPIGRKTGSIIERTVIETGKQAITHYHVLEATTGHSLLDVNLETGRTHQIRVHFSHFGHPLAGDDLYGGSTALMKRQALHCYQITFEHPFTKETMQFRSAIPEDMRQLLSRNS